MRRKANVNKNKGYWQSDNPPHVTTKDISNILLNFCIENNIKSIVDFGCGEGTYITQLINQLKLNKYDAFDGNPYTPKLTNNIGKVKDLSVPFNLNYKYDLVYSLEVAEHLPPIHENVYVNNLLKHLKKHLIISWAPIGQGGSGHYNEQNNDYVINLFQKHGLKFQDLKTEEFRSYKFSKCPWFRNSLLYFIKY